LVAAIRIMPSFASKRPSHQQLVYSLLALVIAAARPAPRWRPTASISSIKMMQGAFFLAARKHVAHAARADADKHLQVGAGW